MAKPLSEQLQRLSYTRRDLELIDAEVDRFITNFIPIIKNTGRANAGRLFLRVLEALIDKLGYGQDMRFRQNFLRTVTEKQSAIDITELVRYVPAGVASAKADLRVTTLTGPAPAVGIPIAQYQIFTTQQAPLKTFIALESAVVPAGASEFFPLPVVEGVRIVNQVLQASTLGEPNEEVRFPVSRTPWEFIEIKVDGFTFEIKEDLKDSAPEDRHCMLRDDADLFTTIIFGDGTYGVKLSPGSVCTSTYIQSQGENGNTPRDQITKVVGSLASLISVNNDVEATGGFDGDEVEDIVRKAPRFASAARGAVTPGGDYFRVGNEVDASVLAEKLVPGVFKALGSEGVGPLLILYIMPSGGGVAGSTILTAVEATLSPRLIHGMTVKAKSLLPADILVKMNVSLKSNKINKSLARRKVFESISAFKLDNTVNPDGALYFRNLTIGRGFAYSDINALIEEIDDGDLVDFVDIVTLTRYPTPIATNIATTVFFNGKIEPLTHADYDEWVITSNSTTTFVLIKNGTVDSFGTIGVQHTSTDGSIRFTLGTSLDTFVPGTDGWTFKTSNYRNNMRLDKFEFMELARDSDLQISIFYPGELQIGE